MKKFLSILILPILALFSSNTCSAAEFSSFNGEARQMTADEICALMDQAEISSYDGSQNYDIAAYTGADDSEMQFSGDGRGSFLNTSDAEPFSLQIVNANADPKSFYLSMGQLYTRGSESAGQLRTGTFAAVEDTGTAASLTASTTNVVSIERFIATTRNKPTVVPLTQWTTTQPTAQLSLAMTLTKQGLVNDETPKRIPFRKYASQNGYNLQFQDIREELYLSPDDLIRIYVAGSSTLSLDLYPVGSISLRKKLQEKVAAVKVNAIGMPGIAQIERNAMSLPRTATGSVVINTGSPLSNQIVSSYNGRRW